MELLQPEEYFSSVKLSSLQRQSPLGIELKEKKHKTRVFLLLLLSFLPARQGLRRDSSRGRGRAQVQSGTSVWGKQGTDAGIASRWRGCRARQSCAGQRPFAWPIPATRRKNSSWKRKHKKIVAVPLFYLSNNFQRVQPLRVDLPCKDDLTKWGTCHENFWCSKPVWYTNLAHRPFTQHLDFFETLRAHRCEHILHCVLFVNVL